MHPEIKIQLVDDHELFLEGIESMLSKIPNYSVKAKASGVDQAIAQLNKYDIDIVITDLNMPEKNGLELIRYIKEELPDTKVIVLTMHNDRATVSEIMMAEAEGYLLKNSAREEFINAIQRVHNGSTHYSNEIMSIILDSYKFEKKIETNKEILKLTNREKEILKLIADEKSSDEIANTLSISKGTVDTHRKNIIKKTNTKSIVGLLKYSYRAGLIAF